LYLIRNVLSSISGCLAFCLAGVASVLKTRAALQLENVALRHQIGVLQRSAKKRPRLQAADRLLWVWLSRVWTDWRSSLVILSPKHCLAPQGFLPFLDMEDPERQARAPAVSRDVRDLIRRMSQENPGWGAPRIHASC
jgi:hypothetical protein